MPEIELYTCKLDEKGVIYYEEFEPIIVAGWEIKNAQDSNVPPLDTYRLECTQRIETPRGLNFEKRYSIMLESALYICDISKEDFENAPQELRTSFDEAMAASRAIVRDNELIRQVKIQLSKFTKSSIESTAQKYSMKFSDFVVSSANLLSMLSCAFPTFRAMEDALTDVMLRHAEYSKDEIAQAMDVTGITPSQAVKLMEELERLRDARKNPNLMAGGSQQAHP